MIKLCVFDFDSTLMDGESIDFFAKINNTSEEVSKITNEAMNGKIDFYEALSKRVKLLKGIEFEKIQKVAFSLPYMNGAKEIISYLRAKNIKVLVFSGGFSIATNHAKEILGFDESFANELHFKNNIATGFVGGHMMFGDSKKKMLLKMQNILNITKTQTMSVGDGANDLSMFELSEKKVAFCAKEILKKQANIIIDDKNLLELKKYI